MQKNLSRAVWRRRLEELRRSAEEVSGRSFFRTAESISPKK
jgi:hypothetical protein